MGHEYIQLAMTIAAGVGTLVSVYVALTLTALKAQLSRDLAEQENRIFKRINGHYTRKEECMLREARILDLVDSVRREAEARVQHCHWKDREREENRD